MTQGCTSKITSQKRIFEIAFLLVLFYSGLLYLSNLHVPNHPSAKLQRQMLNQVGQRVLVYTKRARERERERENASLSPLFFFFFPFLFIFSSLFILFIYFNYFNF